jgi:hypothetical protein
MRAADREGGTRMSHADCHHCGARNFNLLEQSEIDRCRDCGCSLASESDPAEIRARATLAHRDLTRPRLVRRRFVRRDD